ncbi:MAG TPA: cation diffusion facilitator family transporter [Ohtaekwangia sp.]|nr:cation diffusion facilitator family transporter [Ohtaekwangia sp.]
MQAAQKNIRIQLWVAILAVVLLAIKVVAYYITNSVAVLTDAMEGIVNIVAGFIGLYSLTVSAKPRDEDHPYGHGKVEFVSAGLEGTMILIAGGVILFQAVHNLIFPEPIKELDKGVILICATAVANYVMGLICLRAGRRNNSIALQSSGKHLHSDTYSTIGLSLGLLVVYYTRLQWLDSAIAIVFAGIILLTGYRIMRRSLAGIMDETDRSLLEEMVETLNKHRQVNWIDLHNLRIIKYGHILHLDCHLTVPWYLNIHEAHLEIDELTALVRDRFGVSVEFFVHTDGCLEFQCRICNKFECPVRQHPFEKKLAWTVKNISSDKKHRLEKDDG